MALYETVLNDGEIYLRLDRTLAADDELGYVPAYIFTICRCSDDEEVGGCDLRFGHNGTEKVNSTYYGGNIGYHVDEPYRGNRYAARACMLLFELAKERGMDHVVITCNPDNLASKRTCEIVGCELKELAILPEHNAMYQSGEREKLIFVKTL